MTKRQDKQPGGTNDAAFLTNENIAVRWGHCSTETVKRTARREEWTPYRMGGRITRYRREEVEAYEERCARAAPSHSITPPRRRPATAA
jgi:hypothetical protein